MAHHSNYFPKGKEAELSLILNSCGFHGPAFVGQGWSKRVGSDTYGGYVVSLKTLKNGKIVAGVCHAHTEMRTCWEEGSEDCSLPDGKVDPASCKAIEWVTSYGKTKKHGYPKWWFCDKDGNRYAGSRCGFNWNGAYAYRDPSY